MKKLKEPPLAIGGLGLSFFSLGNILGDYSIILCYVLGAIAFGLYFLLLIAVIRSFKTYLNLLRDPLTASIFPTLLMQGMLMIIYCDVFPDLYGITELIFRTIWWLSFILLFIYIIIFSKRFLWNFKLSNVYPSWAVLYIGIGISSVTVPWTGYSYLGKIIFAYILFAVILLLPIVFLRLYKCGIADEVRANIATLCAPALVVVAYQNAFEPVNQSLLLVLVILSQILYVIVLYQIPKILKNGFNPGFSALTFPLIVSATALKGCARYFGNDHWLNGLFTLELIIATLILARVAAGYVKFFRN